MHDAPLQRYFRPGRGLLKTMRTLVIIGEDTIENGPSKSSENKGVLTGSVRGHLAHTMNLLQLYFSSGS